MLNNPYNAFEFKSKVSWRIPYILRGVKYELRCGPPSPLSVGTERVTAPLLTLY